MSKDHTLNAIRAVLNQLGVATPDAPGIEDWAQAVAEADRRLDAASAALPDVFARIDAEFNAPAPPKKVEPLRIRGRKRVKAG